MQDGQIPFATKFMSDKRRRDTDEPMRLSKAPLETSTMSYMPQVPWSEHRPRPQPVVLTEDATSKLARRSDQSHEYMQTSSYPSSSLAATHNPNPPQSMTGTFDVDQPSLTNPLSSTDPGQGWNLSNLLLAQINFGAPSQASGSIQPQFQGGSSAMPLSGVEGRSASSSRPSPGYDKTNQDVAALWSDVPSNFKWVLR
jgi:hypothetical protein